MKKLITYLMNFCSSFLNLQSNVVVFDRRSTVVRPSFDRRSTLQKMVAILMLVLTIGVGNVWGAEQTAYTLSGTTKGGTSNYAEVSNITQSSKDWKVLGNTDISPWRIGGGKNTSGTNTNRYIYSQTAITENITKVVVTHGSKSNMTVNSVTLNVYSTAAKAATGGTGDISSVSVTYVDNGDMTFNRPAGHNWAGRFFRIDYYLTWTSSNSAKYIPFSSAVFKYDDAPACSAPAAPTISGTAAYTAGQTITLPASCASGADASTTYTWYKGADWATARAASPVQATSTSGATFTKASCVVGDAGKYWCEASNGSGCEAHNSTGYDVTVSAGSVAVTGVSVDPTSKAIVPNETFTITPTVSPANATDKSVSWTSSATSYATVSSGTVTGVAAGSSTITCRTTDGGYTATCAVTVYGVTMQARDEDGNAIAGGGPGAPTRSGATITAAANAGNYVFMEWDVANALVASTTTTPTTISNPTDAVTVTAKYHKPITITYKANNQVFTTQTYAYNGTLAFPVSEPDGATYSCTGKTFVGWVAEANKNYYNASTPPTYATDGGSVTTDATYYAVFATASGGGSITKTDEFTYTSFFSACTPTGSNVNGAYTNFSSISGSESDAVYAGNLMEHGDGPANCKDYIQMRSKNSNSGIITTTSGGTAKKVTVEWNSAQAADKVLNIYGKSTAYSAASDLYNDATDGDLLGTITSGTSTEYSITGDYEHIGIRSADGGLFFDEISIDWQVGGGVSYSDYTTSCSCSSYSFHDGTSGSNPSDWQINCFAYSGNSDRQWIKNFTIRNKSHYYVGNQGNFYNDNLGNNNAKSYTNQMQYMQLALDRGHNSNNQLGSNYAGVQGTLLCYDNSSSDNLYVDFLPDGYYFLLDAANTPTALPMTCTDPDMTAANILSHNTVWETDIQTVTSVSYKYSIGIKADASIAGQAWQKTRYNTNEDMTSLQKRNASSGFTGSLAAADVSAKARGKYRIWANNFSTTSGEKNWYAHFVPYIGVTYYDADNSSVISQTSDANAVSIEAAAGDKQFTISATAPTKTNYTFVGWNTAANQTTATYTNGQANVSLSAWTYLYPAFTENPKANVTISVPGGNGTVTSSHTTNVYQGTTVTLTITPSSGYQLASISAVDASSNTVSLSGTGNSRTFEMPASAVTVTAAFVVRTDYVLVESALDDYSGEYLIVYHNSGTGTLRALSGRNGNQNANTYGTYTDVATYYNSTEKSIESNSTTDAMKMVVEPTETASRYSIYFANDNSYLGCSTGSATGNLRFITSNNLASNEYEWRFVWNSTDNVSEVSIYNNANSDPKWLWLLYNAQNPRFALYTSGTDIELYKKVETCEKLAAPTGLTASSITQTTVTLSWTAVANASDYEISLDNGSSWTSTSTNTSYNATGLTAGTTYTWKVRAKGDGSTYCTNGTAASSTVTMKSAVSVTYNGNSPTSGSVPATANLTEGDSYTVAGNTGTLVKDGYTWAGWHSSTTYNATPAYGTGGSTITVNSSIILYANWAPKTDTYKDGVHNNSDKTGSGVYTAPTAFPDETRATSGNCETTHFKFIGWVEESDFNTNGSSATIIAPGTSMTATGATYYAVWGEEL